jgi:hypothetical protein
MGIGSEVDDFAESKKFYATTARVNAAGEIVKQNGTIVILGCALGAAAIGTAGITRALTEVKLAEAVGESPVLALAKLLEISVNQALLVDGWHRAGDSIKTIKARLQDMGEWPTEEESGKTEEAELVGA